MGYIPLLFMIRVSLQECTAWQDVTCFPLPSISRILLVLKLHLISEQLENVAAQFVFANVTEVTDRAYVNHQFSI